jgi:hypothetical protein
VREPITAQDWSLAVSSAWGLLIVKKAVEMGVLHSGLTVNVERCEEMVARGEALGFRPNPSILRVIAEKMGPPQDVEPLARLLLMVSREVQV